MPANRFSRLLLCFFCCFLKVFLKIYRFYCNRKWCWFRSCATNLQSSSICSENALLFKLLSYTLWASDVIWFTCGSLAHNALHKLSTGSMYKYAIVGVCIKLILGFAVTCHHWRIQTTNNPNISSKDWLRMQRTSVCERYSNIFKSYHKNEQSETYLIVLFLRTLTLWLKCHQLLNT